MGLEGLSSSPSSTSRVVSQSFGKSINKESGHLDRMSAGVGGQVKLELLGYGGPRAPLLQLARSSHEPRVSQPRSTTILIDIGGSILFP